MSIKELIQKIEYKNNLLDFEISRKVFPKSEMDILDINNDLSNLRKEAKKQTNIEKEKNLIIQQLSKYIGVIENEHIYPFSKKQGICPNMFYLSPMIDIKNIVLLSQNSINGVNYILTLDNNDIVDNKVDFLNFLKNKKTKVLKLNNLCELFDFYIEFKQNVIENFC